MLISQLAVPVKKQLLKNIEHACSILFSHAWLYQILCGGSIELCLALNTRAIIVCTNTANCFRNKQ